MIDLYTHYTPNGYKITIALEELGLPYTVEVVDLMKGEQFAPDFVALNPNGKIPVIVDHDTGQAVFESCAILLYLAEKTGRLLPATPEGRIEAIQWLFFQAASIGPMFGQLGHFSRYAPEKIPYAVERYTKETHRLLAVLERRLEDRDWLLEDYSIVDIAHFGWVYFMRVWLEGFEQYANVLRWHDRVLARPAVQKAVTVPMPNPQIAAFHEAQQVKAAAA